MMIDTDGVTTAEANEAVAPLLINAKSKEIKVSVNPADKPGSNRLRLVPRTGFEPVLPG